MYANIEECEKAGLDPQEVDRIAKGLSRYAKQAAALSITIFGGTAACDLRKQEPGKPDSRALILADVDGRNFDGGDGACWEDEEGLIRGE